MCLFTEQEKPKVCVKPIRCMKIVRRSENGGWYVPLYEDNGLRYAVGKETSIFSCEVGDFMNPYHGSGFTRVGNNRIHHGLHSYSYNNENVPKLIDDYTFSFSGNLMAVLECEIPLGALYYEGYQNTKFSVYDRGILSETGFCSNRLRVIREIPVSEVCSEKYRKKYIYSQ